MRRPSLRSQLLSARRMRRILDLSRAHIDARQFNPAFPATFPRFVQSAIWRYCAENGLDVCNGNRIDDDARCDNAHCQLFRRCDRIALRAEMQKSLYFSDLSHVLTTRIGCNNMILQLIV